MSGRGTLFLVVGPSGAGKDTLLDGARAALAGDDGVVFARRVISRPADAGGEEHDPIDTAAFDRAEADGAFMLSWRAHDLRYGIPARYADVLGEGRSVVANVSRSVIDLARSRLQPVRVVQVTAPADLLAGRLAERGREDELAIARRLARASAVEVEGTDVVHVVNDGTVAEGVARMVAVLSGGCQRPTAA